ncbi:hypothetical protein SESBI_24800 [Sesbania bispinosa]|nr:hypothetical protein SESBI_24800 [Sesbania bispinosa]
MANNNYQWSMDRMNPKKVAGFHEVDAITSLSAAAANKLDNLSVNPLQSPFVSCCNQQVEHVHYAGQYCQNYNGRDPYLDSYVE